MPASKALNRELEGELDRVFTFWEECRPITAGIEYSMKLIKLFVQHLNTKQPANKQKQKIYDKIDYIIQDKIILADEAIIQKALALFSNTEEDVILTYQGI